jgi:hydroxyacylglutathione hydrolase
MGPANLAGPPGPDLSPPRQASAAEVRRRAEAGEWVIDLRDRIAFAAGYLPGSVSFPLEGSFASYLGWTVPWGAPLTLLGETPEQVGQAQRELARIWADRPAAAASGGPARWAAGAPLAALRLAKYGDLAAAMTAGRPVVLDVRRRLEWAESHIAGARHIPLYELSSRAGELPPGAVWVHCHGGYRAIVAASLLARRGRQVVSVDDDFANAAAAGLPLQPA